MAMWEIIWDESLGRPDRTMVIWSARDQNAGKVLFEVNEQGLELWYYQNALDAVIGDKNLAIARSCYGQATIEAEEGRIDGWLDKVFSEQDSTELTECSHDGKSCEDMFDEAQEMLGN